MNEDGNNDDVMQGETQQDEPIYFDQTNRNVGSI